MQVFQLRVGRVCPNELVFTPSGNALVIGALPYVLFDLSSGGKQQNLEPLGLGSWGWALIRNGAAIAHIPSSKQVQVYEIQSREVHRHEVEKGDARAIATNQSGDTIYLSVGALGFRAESEIRVVRASDMTVLSTFGKVDDFPGQLSLSWDETTIATSGGNLNALLRGENISFRVWNIANGNLPGQARVRIEPPNVVNAFALTSAGDLLAVAESTALSLWNTTSGEEVFRSGKHRRKVTTVACSPAHPILITGDKAGHVFVWDYRGNILARYDWGLGEIYSLAFAPDGLRAAAVDHSGKLVVWDVDV